MLAGTKMEPIVASGNPELRWYSLVSQINCAFPFIDPRGTFAIHRFPLVVSVTTLCALGSCLTECQDTLPLDK